MRLIDACMLDNVITKLNAQGAGITRMEYKIIDNVLFNFPTIEERKAGIWHRKLSTHFGPKLNDIIICSICGTAFSSENMVRRAYCPQCGSRMLGTKEV